MSLSKTSKHSILLVDDCDVDRIVCKRYLLQGKLLDYEFTEATTIAAAFEEFSTHRPSAILLDYWLPDGTGIDLMDRLRSEYPSHEICVIMLTGQEDGHIIIDCMKKGALDYLTKGQFSSDQLNRAVYNALEKSALIRELHQQQLEKDRLIAELKQALEDIKTLRGILPICAQCKKIRDDSGFWRQVEDYMSRHIEARFSHGLCPECIKEFYAEFGIAEESQ